VKPSSGAHVAQIQSSRYVARCGHMLMCAYVCAGIDLFKAHQHIDAVAESALTRARDQSQASQSRSATARSSVASSALRRRGQQLRADRRGGALRHMLADVKKGEVVEADVDFDKLARKLEVLQPWEKASHDRR